MDCSLLWGGELAAKRRFASTRPSETCAGEDMRVVQENGFMRVEGLHLNSWILDSPPLQEILDPAGIMRETFGSFPGALVQTIAVNSS